MDLSKLTKMFYPQQYANMFPLPEDISVVIWMWSCTLVAASHANLAYCSNTEKKACKKDSRMRSEGESGPYHDISNNN